MPEDLGIYSLQDNSASEYEDHGVGDVCSLSSEASEEEIHENRKRMSLDLSAIPLSTSLAGLPSLETGLLAIMSAITDGSNGEVVIDVKSFEDTDKNVKPGTLMRVQSDAMLNAAEEASKALGSSRSSSDECLEEVLTLKMCEKPSLDCNMVFFVYLTYKVLELMYVVVTKVCIHLSQIQWHGTSNLDH